jgi:hypothetical protein
MNKKTWRKLLGYDPDKTQKEYLLAMVQDEGITLAEACSRMSLPPLYIQGVDEPDPDEYDNPYKPAIYIKTRDDNE